MGPPTDDDRTTGFRSWSIHPQPKEDETITSWLMRFAAAHDLTPFALLTFIHGTSSNDGLPATYHPFYARLSMISGVPETALRALVPSRWHAVDDIRDCLYSCCPECLATDTTPYLRRSWQDPDLFACPVHRLMLSRQCSVCREHWTLKAFAPGGFVKPHDWTVCPNPKCGVPVLESSSGTLAEDHPVLWLQQELRVPDRSGIAHLRDGRGIERRFIHWLFQNPLSRSLPRFKSPYDAYAGLYSHWLNLGDPGARIALDLAALLQHPASDDLELLDALIQETLTQLGQLSRSQSRTEGKRFVAPTQPPTLLATFYVLYLAKVEFACLTSTAIASNDLRTALERHPGIPSHLFPSLLTVCERGVAMLTAGH